MDAERDGSRSVFMRDGKAKWVWAIVGALLMALAVWMGLRGGGVARALESLSGARVLVVAGVLTLPIASWLLTATLFWVLTKRFGRVAWGEMLALIGAAWLLNNIPLRPGMVGRVTYHRLVNGIPIRASLRVLVEALACSAVAAGCAVAIVAFAGGQTLLGAGVSAGALAGGVAAVVVLRRGTAALPVGLLLAGVLLRLADVATWWLRYHLLLDLMGLEATALQVMAITVASQVASLTPVQFGLREWAVGGVASLAQAGRAGVLSAGLSADLLNRGVELLLSIPIGLVCSGLVTRWMRPHRADADEASATEGVRDRE